MTTTGITRITIGMVTMAEDIILAVVLILVEVYNLVETATA